MRLAFYNTDEYISDKIIRFQAMFAFRRVYSAISFTIRRIYENHRAIYGVYFCRCGLVTGAGTVPDD